MELSLADALKVPVPPLTTLHAPVPGLGLLPPKLAVVPSAQIVCVAGLAVAAGAAGVIVMLTSAVVAAQGALLIVQRTTTGPTPVRCVNVEVALVDALNVPVPPLTTLHAPVPGLGLLPPKLAVVPSAQIVCVAGLAVAAGAAGVIVMLTSANVDGQDVSEIVQRNTTGPVPVACVKVDVGLVALLNVPVPPLCTVHSPVPVPAALPPKLVVVPSAQIVCGPPTDAGGAEHGNSSAPISYKLWFVPPRGSPSKSRVAPPTTVPALTQGLVMGMCRSAVEMNKGSLEMEVASLEVSVLHKAREVRSVPAVPNPPVCAKFPCAPLVKRSFLSDVRFV